MELTTFIRAHEGILGHATSYVFRPDFARLAKTLVEGQELTDLFRTAVPRRRLKIRPSLRGV